MSEPLTPETELLHVDGELPLESGDSLDGVRVAYRTWGEPQSEAILICHALTGSADADDWWAGMFGQGKPFDPATDYIISANALGGCYGTTGPTSPRPDGDGWYGGSFPEVTIRDMVSLQAKLLNHLDVDRLKLVIGGSMGGMQAMEFAFSYPDRVAGAVSIGAGIAQSAWGVALSEPQRAAITGDPKFKRGKYLPNEQPRDGLATARMIAMISYRGYHNFESRFGRRSSEEGFEIQSYLRYQGKKLVDRFDANSYLRLIGAMDSHDLARGRGERSEVLSSFTAPVLAVGISSDVLFPAAEVRDLAHSLPNGRYATLHAAQGHDAFLIETDALGRIVTGFKEELRTGLRPASRDLESARGAAWA